MARRAGSRVGNLPSDLTSLIGRRSETSEVRRLLSECRLVTLVGPGGVGKTRLAVETARQSNAAFADGSWLVSLGELTERDLLVSTVMSTLSNVGATRIRALVDYIGTRRMLLVLDNCEHLSEACAELVAELLRACPQLKVLATSREPLRVDGEGLFWVSPLATPPGGEQAPAAASDQFDAVELFAARAKAVNRDFRIDDSTRDAVVTVCQRLDGLPLAIELAAAGTRVLPLDRLVGLVDDGLADAVYGSRSAPARHQSLLATMTYSYQLCSDPARLLWARMSVFRGGADLEAIETICGDEWLPAEEIRPVLGELVDKSIVMFDGERYRLLQIIRSYGREQLRELGEVARVRRAHRGYFAAIAEALEDGWFGPDQSALLDQMFSEQANMRAVLDFCADDPGEVTAGLRIACQLYAFWLTAGLASEARHWFGRLLDIEKRPIAERAAALWVHGFFTSVDGDVPTALALFDEGLELAERLGDDASVAHAVQKRGLAELMAGRTEDALRRLEEAVRLERAVAGFNPLLADALLDLGVALCLSGERVRAVAVLDEARALCSERGELLLHSWAVLIQAYVAYFEGRVDEALVNARDALADKRALGDTLGIVWCIEIIAWVALVRGDIQRASRLLGVGEALSEPLGYHLANFRALVLHHDEHVEQARFRLGSRAFGTARRQGCMLNRDEAMAYALEERDAVEVEEPSVIGTVPLTNRERQIAELVAVGKTNREIAAALVIAHRTVDTHVEHILGKLNFTSRTQIAALYASGTDNGRASV